MDVYASQTKRMQMFLWATSSLHVVLLLVAAYQREIGGVFNLAAVMALGKMLNDVSKTILFASKYIVLPFCYNLLKGGHRIFCVF